MSDSTIIAPPRMRTTRRRSRVLPWVRKAKKTATRAEKTTRFRKWLPIMPAPSALAAGGDVEGVEDEQHVHQAGGQQVGAAVLVGRMPHALSEARQELLPARIAVLGRQPVDQASKADLAGEHFDRAEGQVVEGGQVAQRLLLVGQGRRPAREQTERERGQHDGEEGERAPPATEGEVPETGDEPSQDAGHERGNGGSGLGR